jgi:hypothetical protein
MSKACAQAGFVIVELALGDGEVAGGVVALHGRAADQTFDGVQDGTRAVDISGE